MILYYTGKDERPRNIDRLAAEMVDVSMSRKESVCAILQGVPLVTYPNDIRSRPDKIGNITRAFMDGWVRSQMTNIPVLEHDTRFDPKFECEICKLSSVREETLRQILRAFTNLAQKKLPRDEDVTIICSTVELILRTTGDQREIVEKFREILKP